MTRPGYYSGRSRRPVPVRPPDRPDRSGWRGQSTRRTGPADRQRGQTDRPDTDVIRPDSTKTARPDTRTERPARGELSGQTANESSR